MLFCIIFSINTQCHKLYSSIYLGEYINEIHYTISTWNIVISTNYIFYLHFNLSCLKDFYFMSCSYFYDYHFSHTICYFFLYISPNLYILFKRFFHPPTLFVFNTYISPKCCLLYFILLIFYDQILRGCEEELP